MKPSGVNFYVSRLQAACSAWRPHALILVVIPAIFNVPAWVPDTFAAGLEQPANVLGHNLAENGRTDPAKVHVAAESVTVDVENVPLADILERLARQGGVKIWTGPQSRSKVVTESFSNLSMEEALRRLLQGTNYVLVGGGDGSIVEVFVLGPANESDANARGPRSFDARAEALANALEPGRLPDSVRTAMIANLKGTDQIDVPEENIPELWIGALEKIAEQLESSNGETETSQKLRAAIQQLQESLTQ